MWPLASSRCSSRAPARPRTDPLPRLQYAEIDDSALPVPVSEGGASAGEEKKLRKNVFIIFAHGQELLEKIRKIAECALSSHSGRDLSPALTLIIWLQSNGRDAVPDRLERRQARGQAPRGDVAHRGPQLGPLQHEPDPPRGAHQDLGEHLGVVGRRPPREDRLLDAQPVAVGPGSQDARRRGLGPDARHPAHPECAQAGLRASFVQLSFTSPH